MKKVIKNTILYIGLLILDLAFVMLIVTHFDFFLFHFYVLYIFAFLNGVFAGYKIN